MANKDTGARITVCMPPGMYEQVMKVAQLYGFSDSAAARHLMTIGLQSMLGVIASTQSAQLMGMMVNAIQAEADEAAARKRKSPVVVTPDYGVKNHTRGVSEERERKH